MTNGAPEADFTVRGAGTTSKLAVCADSEAGTQVRAVRQRTDKKRFAFIVLYI